MFQKNQQYKHWSATLKGRCPACLEGKIYRNLLSVGEACPACGEDLSKSDVGDGAAYIAICIVGTLVVLGAIWMEFAFAPPVWLHVLIWLPATLLGTIAVLKLAKTWLIHTEYRYRNKNK